MPWRFNPAPGWPPPPPGFTPGSNWAPDPSWPAAPYEWQFWIEEPEAKPPPPADGDARLAPHGLRLLAFGLDVLVVAVPCGLILGCKPAAVSLSTKSAALLWVSTAVATTGIAVAATPGPDYRNIQVVTEFGTIDQPETDEIYRMNADGSDFQRLTSNSFEDAAPSLFRDRRIVFQSDRDGDDEIYAMNTSGSHQKRLTDDAGADDQAAWSPDGKRIAFTSDRDGNTEIYLMNVNGSNRKRLTNNSVPDFQPTWAPNGKKILFTSGRGLADPSSENEIWAMDPNGAHAVKLTSVNHD